MMILARRIEHALDVAVQRLHDTDAREHRRPVKFCDQRLHRDLPFVGIVFCLRQLGDVGRGVSERDQRLLPTLHQDRIEKPLIP
jgi:hypothetical protein